MLTVHLIIADVSHPNLPPVWVMPAVSLKVSFEANQFLDIVQKLTLYTAANL